MTEFRAIYSAVERLRKEIPKSQRLRVWGKTSYSCSCGVSQQVDVCNGVCEIELNSGVPIPYAIPCSSCGEQMTTDGAGVESYMSGEFKRVVPGRPYLRIPSTRALVHLARNGRYEAQYVEPR